jgi:hypothetical protein
MEVSDFCFNHQSIISFISVVLSDSKMMTLIYTDYWYNQTSINVADLLLHEDSLKENILSDIDIVSNSGGE